MNVLRASHAAQLAVFPARSGFGGYFRAVARLPEVSSSASATFLQMSPPGPGASPFSGLTAEASPAGDDGVALDRVKVLAGRLFDLFAGSAGVGSQADVPVSLVLLVIPVTLILAVLLAAVPGWTAGRIRPALILRSE